MTTTTGHVSRASIMLAPLVLLLAMAACRAAPRSADSGSTQAFVTESSVPEPSVAPDMWKSRLLGVSPLSARENAFVAWTGAEMLIVGGDADPCPPYADCFSAVDPLTEAAAYDPAADRWRTIAQPGEPVGPGVTVDGRVYVRTRSNGLLSYDAEADVWKAESPGFALPGQWAHMVAVGDAIVFLASGNDDHKLATLVTWTPSTGAVRTLPPPPLPAMFNVKLASSNGTIVLLGAELVPNPGADGPSLLIGATYDSGAGWQRLPPAEILGSGGPWVAVGDLLICIDGGQADGGQIGNYGRFFPFGGVLDVAKRKWRPLPTQPTATSGSSGEFYMVLGAEVLSSDGLLLDPRADAWRTWAVPHDASDALGREGAAGVWTGSEMLIWGGVTWTESGSVLHDDGVALRPPSLEP